jgi:hypothetical protein
MFSKRELIMEENQEKPIQPSVPATSGSVKPLVEGIISLVLAAGGIAYPIVTGVTTLAYRMAKAGDAVCTATDGSGNTHVCSADELSTLQLGLKTVAIAVLILAIIGLGASIILGIFARKNGVAAGNAGKARAGMITGTIGFILAAVLLLLSLIFVVVAFVAIK